MIRGRLIKATEWEELTLLARVQVAKKEGHPIKTPYVIVCRKRRPFLTRPSMVFLSPGSRLFEINSAA